MVEVLTSSSISSRKRSGRSSDQGAAPVINIAHKRGRQAVLGLKRESNRGEFTSSTSTVAVEHIQLLLCLNFIYSGNGFVKNAVIWKILLFCC